MQSQSPDLAALAFPVLFADIGGTNARFALLEAPDAALLHFPTVETRLHATIEDALADAILPAAGAVPRSMVFALAGPIREERTQLTNCPWVVYPRGLIAQFALEGVILFNDFEALALCLPGLSGEDLRPVGPALPPAAGTKLVIGPGTGLGAAGLVDAGGRWVPVPGEGGHIDLAAVTARDEAIWPQIERPGLRVSGETLVCGSGLLRLYTALCRTDGIPATCTSPAEVTAAAEAGDPAARETVELFALHLGRVAGSLALTFLSRGGVYLAGGIAPRIAHVLDAVFRGAFEDKYPHEDLLKGMATVIVVHERPALAGLVDYARAPDRFAVTLTGRSWHR